MAMAGTIRFAPTVMRNGYNCCQVNNRHNLFDFFDNRCAATSTGASGGCHDGCGHTRILQVHGNFLTKPF